MYITVYLSRRKFFFVYTLHQLTANLFIFQATRENKQQVLNLMFISLNTILLY